MTDLRRNLSQLWPGALAITLAVAFVVAGTMIAGSIRSLITQHSLELPLATTGVLTAPDGRLPAEAAAFGVPAPRQKATLLGPDARAEVAGGRAVVLADPRAVRVVSGQLPSGPDEMALDATTARIVDAEPGDTVHVRAASGQVRSLALTGIAEPLAGSEAMAMTAEGMQAVLGAGFDRVLLTGSPAENAAVAARFGLPASAVTDVTSRLAAQAERAESGLGTLGLLLSALTLVLAVAGTFVIANTFAVVAAGRRQEAALLRAVGATQRQLRNRYLREAVVLGTVASAAGVVLGSLVGAIITPLIGLGVGPTIGVVVLGMVMGLTVTVVGTWGPIRGIARTAPMIALGEAELTEVQRPSQVRWTLTVPLLVLTAMALQVPIVGAVIGGLLTFVCLIVLGPLLVPWIGRWVMSGPLRRGPIARMARANVTTHARRSARTATAVLMGVALATSTTALLSAVGKVHELDAGRGLTVYAPTATDEMRKQLVSLDSVEYVARVSGSQFEVGAAGPLAQTTRDTEKVLADWPGARIGSAADRRAELAADTAWITVSLGSVAAMSLLLGLLGVLNTVRLSTRQRRREFAVLRAVGMTRRQLMQMVVAEAAGLTGIGVVLGLLLGGATIYGMLGAISLLLVPFISWWLIALICLGVVALVAASAVLPAWSAARTSPALAAAEAAT